MSVAIIRHESPLAIERRGVSLNTVLSSVSYVLGNDRAKCRTVLRWWQYAGDGEARTATGNVLEGRWQQRRPQTFNWSMVLQEGSIVGDQ